MLPFGGGFLVYLYYRALVGGAYALCVLAQVTFDVLFNLEHRFGLAFCKLLLGNLEVD